MKYWAILFGVFFIGVGSAFGATNDEVFAHAQNAYQSKNVKALTEDVKQLTEQNYLLAPYADYWLMLITLSNSDKDLVKEFLYRYPDYPFTDRVRVEWLKSLGKRQDWDSFFEELPNLKREDIAVNCYALEGRARKGDVLALTEGKVLWMTSDRAAGKIKTGERFCRYL